MGSTTLLTELDDTLFHQAPLPFAYVASSDHRFYDRYWFQGFTTDGPRGFILGMGRYANMNVLDGFLTIQEGGRQHNVRVSRALRPALHDTSVGGLNVEVKQGLQKFRLQMEKGKYPIACDVTWTGAIPTYMEGHSLNYANDRVTTDMYRLDQIGSVNGFLEIDGERVDVSDWWGARDHSWGVRPGVGGFEPTTGVGGGGRFFVWLLFKAGDIAGQFQLHENPDGERQFLDGYITGVDGSDQEEVEVVDVEHDIEFHPGTRAWKQCEMTLTTSDGQKWKVESKPTFAAGWAYSGTGYDGGWIDRKGLGAFRGEFVSETDTYDVSDPEIVRDLEGNEIDPGLREQPSTIKVNGVDGMAHFPIMIGGPYHRYGIK